MKNLVQSKYQTEPLPEEAEPTEWRSDAAARKAKPPSNFGVGTDGQRGGRLNRLPPGSDSGKPDLPFAMADATDQAPSWNAQSVERGFKRLKVAPGCAEDVPFDPYGDAVADGQHGFAERRGVLDRI